MEKIYVLGGCRTAIGSLGGALKEISAAKLGEVVLREALLRSGVKAAEVGQVMMGNVLQAGQGQNPARQAAVFADIPAAVPAVTLNKVCGSGLYVVNLAAALVAAGQEECVLVGGMENMSRAPHTLQMRWGQKMGNATLRDSMIQEGLWDVFNDYHMGITAENVAREYGITRQEQDEFSWKSQQKATAAIQNERFRDEIVPVYVPQRKGEPLCFDADEHVRTNASIETLGKLHPAFCKEGTVTEGNASGINDGAAAMVIASERFVRERGLEPQARWICGASCGVDPSVMGIGPVSTVEKALRLAEMQIEDIDLMEVNEAFAAQAVAVMRGLDADEKKVNVNGGAIALGHPIGASGARITVTLLHELRRRSCRYGLSTLCIGGGMGEAAIFERDALCK